MKGYFTPILSAVACMACFSAPASADLTTEVIHTLNYSASYLLPIDGYGNTAAWQGEDFRIYYWDGVSVQVISPPEHRAYAPSLYNGKIAYNASNTADGNTPTLFYWDGTYSNGQPNIVEITTSTQNIADVSLNNGRIAWTATDGNDLEVFYWNGSYSNGQPDITQITNNNVNDVKSRLDDNRVVWRQQVAYNDNSIYYWDGTTTHLLDTTGATPGTGQVDAENGGVVWAGSNASGYSAIYYWDGTFTNGSPNIETVDEKTQQSWQTVMNPSLHDGNVAYVKDLGDEAIYYWDGTTNTQLSEKYRIDGFFVPSVTSSGVFYMGRNAVTGLHEVRYVTSTGLCL